MLVAHNRKTKCHTFWRLAQPPGDATNEHLQYILARQLYTEAAGASDEVVSSSFGCVYVHAFVQANPWMTSVIALLLTRKKHTHISFIVGFIIDSTASEDSVHHQCLD